MEETKSVTISFERPPNNLGRKEFEKQVYAVALKACEALNGLQEATTEVTVESLLTLKDLKQLPKDLEVLRICCGDLIEDGGLKRLGVQLQNCPKLRVFSLKCDQVINCSPQAVLEHMSGFKERLRELEIGVWLSLNQITHLPPKLEKLTLWTRDIHGPGAPFLQLLSRLPLTSFTLEAPKMMPMDCRYVKAKALSSSDKSGV